MNTDTVMARRRYLIQCYNYYK